MTRKSTELESDEDVREKEGEQRGDEGRDGSTAAVRVRRMFVWCLASAPRRTEFLASRRRTALAGGDQIGRPDRGLRKRRRIVLRSFRRAALARSSELHRRCEGSMPRCTDQSWLQSTVGSVEELLCASGRASGGRDDAPARSRRTATGYARCERLLQSAPACIAERERERERVESGGLSAGGAAKRLERSHLRSPLHAQPQVLQSQSWSRPCNEHLR